MRTQERGKSSILSSSNIIVITYKKNCTTSIVLSRTDLVISVHDLFPFQTGDLGINTLSKEAFQPSLINWNHDLLQLLCYPQKTYIGQTKSFVTAAPFPEPKRPDLIARIQDRMFHPDCRRLCMQNISARWLIEIASLQATWLNINTASSPSLPYLLPTKSHKLQFKNLDIPIKK